MSKFQGHTRTIKINQINRTFSFLCSFCTNEFQIDKKSNFQKISEVFFLLQQHLTQFQVSYFLLQMQSRLQNQHLTSSKPNSVLKFYRKSSRSSSHSHEKSLNTKDIKNFYVKAASSNITVNGNSNKGCNIQQMIKKRVVLGQEFNRSPPKSKQKQPKDFIFGICLENNQQRKVNQEINESLNTKKQNKGIMSYEKEFEKQLTQQLKNENLMLKEEIKNLKMKINEQQRTIYQITNSPQTLNFENAQNFITAKLNTKLIQQTNSNTLQSSFVDDSFCSTGTSFYKKQDYNIDRTLNQTLESQINQQIKKELFQIKQKVRSLEIELQCEKRKREKALKQLADKKDKQYFQLKKKYSNFLTEYKQKMKRSFSQTIAKCPQNKVKKIEKKPSFELEYSQDQEN